MKFRDLVFLVIGGLLVISGMVLNSVLVTDAEAQVGLKDAEFGYIMCKGVVVKGGGFALVDDGYKERGTFGLDTDGDAMLKIYGDDGKTPVAYLGGNTKQNNEMVFQLESKSKSVKREVRIQIYENGGKCCSYWSY